MRNRRIRGLIVIFTLFLLLVGCSSNEEYEMVRYKVNMSLIGSGKILKTPDRTSYVRGSKVTLEAKPDAGWKFLRWERDGITEANKEQNPLDITVSKDMNITAVFQDLNARHALEVKVVGIGSVIVEPVQELYTDGAQVTLRPVPGDGYLFSYWQGDDNTSRNPLTITMNKNMSITAVFAYDAGEIKFSDPDLEIAVRAALNKPTGPITVGDALRLTALDASYRKLEQSLGGLEYFTALTELNLNYTLTSDISQLADMTRLRWLYLQDNQISDLDPVSKMGFLERLDLGKNRIQNIDPLIWLGNNNMRILKLNDNQISSLWGIKGLTRLEELNLANNQITNIAYLLEMDQLITLDLSGNRIASVSEFEGRRNVWPNLQVLNMNENDLGSLKDLVWLWQYQNSKIREIDLAGNELSEVNYLYGLSNLEYVDLRNNQIAEIYVLAKLSQNSPSRIRVAHLENNQIRYLYSLEEMPYLEELYLDSNLLGDIEPLLKIPNLKRVTLTDNPTLFTPENRDATMEVIRELEEVLHVNVTY